MAAPAVAVLGALAAAPQIRDLASTGPASATGQMTASRLLGPGKTASAGGGPASISDETFWPQHAKAASAGSAARAARAAVHHSAKTAASSGGSASHQGSAASGQGSSSGGQGSAAAAGGSGTVTCSATSSGGMLPANYAAIVNFLTAHGYTGMAAAGIAGNIYQESGGNPESIGTGGGGLIGWTPLPGGFVTGNPVADLQTQLAAILTFNQQWAQYLPALNAAATPAAAADIYVTDFERAGIPAFGNREAAAEAVAQACGL